MPGKYNSKKIVIDGYTFDSIVESQRYGELVMMRCAGEITDLQVHPVFVLLDAFTDARGRKHRALTYESDFIYRELNSGLVVIEDVKGIKTKEFRIKEKLLCRVLPVTHEFRVIKMT